MLHVTSMKAQPRYGCVPCCTWGDNSFAREFFRDYDDIGNPGNTNRFNTGEAAGLLLRWCHCTIFSGKAGMCRMHTGGGRCAREEGVGTMGENSPRQGLFSKNQIRETA